MPTAWWTSWSASSPRQAATSPIVRIPTLADGADRARLLEAVQRHVRPADARYQEAVRAYLPATREAPGLCALPDGEARYATKVKGYTSLDVTPAELHRIGLWELEEIEGRRRRSPWRPASATTPRPIATP